MFKPDTSNPFEHENNFYLTASPARFSKFATHLDLFRQTSTVPGEIVECGVFKGCSLSRFIKFRSLFEHDFSRKIIGLDIFGKFPEADLPADREKRDAFIAQAGAMGISKVEFEHLLREQGLHKNVELIEGDIRQTALQYLNDNPQLKISLLHIDVDLYEATKVALETFYPAVASGGIVILDDYAAFPGANKAIDEYFSGTETQILRLPYSHSICYIQKS